MVLRNESSEIKEIGVVYRCEHFLFIKSDTVAGCMSTQCCAFLQAGALGG